MIKCKLLLTNLFLLFALNKALASIISYQKTNDGVNFSLDKGKMFISIIEDDLVEAKYTNLSAIPEKKSLVVLHSASFKKSFSVSETKDAFSYTDNTISIEMPVSLNKPILQIVW